MPDSNLNMDIKSIFNRKTLPVVIPTYTLSFVSGLFLPIADKHGLTWLSLVVVLCAATISTFGINKIMKLSYPIKALGFIAVLPYGLGAIIGVFVF